MFHVKLSAAILILFAFAGAAFQGRSVPKTMVVGDSSITDTLSQDGNSLISITVMGAAHGAFITIRDSIITSGRKTGTRANQNILFPIGTTVIARPSPSAYLTAVSADTGVSDTINVQLGVNK